MNFMVTIEKASKKKVKKYTGSDIIKKILADRKMIKDHLAKGGTLEQLKDKGFPFATI